MVEARMAKATEAREKRNNPFAIAGHPFEQQFARDALKRVLPNEDPIATRMSADGQTVHVACASGQVYSYSIEAIRLAQRYAETPEQVVTKLQEMTRRQMEQYRDAVKQTAPDYLKQPEQTTRLPSQQPPPQSWSPTGKTAPEGIDPEAWEIACARRDEAVSNGQAWVCDKASCASVSEVSVKDVILNVYVLFCRSCALRLLGRDARHGWTLDGDPEEWEREDHNAS